VPFFYIALMSGRFFHSRDLDGLREALESSETAHRGQGG